MLQIITTSILSILIATNLNAQEATSHFVPQDFSSIQDAMNIADQGDTILVSPGTYYENLIWPSGKDLYLKSLDGNAQTIIDGGKNDRVIVLEFLTAASTIDGFTIQNGFTEDEQGAGIMGRNSSVNFENLIIRDNSIAGEEGEGAGVHLIAYNGRIISCQFKNNVIDVNDRASGGGLYLRLDGDVIIESCSFDDNQSRGSTHAEAGGLFMYWHGINFTGFQTPVVNINNSTFSKNCVAGDYEIGAGISISGFGPYYHIFADSTTISGNKSLGDSSFGGGIRIYSTVNVTMTDCIIDRNVAANGAGFYQSSVTDESVSHLDRCKVSNNVTTMNNSIHGAVEVYKKGTCTLSNCEVSNGNAYAIVSENLSGDSHLNLNNCTLAKNEASIHIRSTDLVVSNSVIWNEDSIAVEQHLFNADNNIDISYSVLKGGSNNDFNGINIIDADPLFMSEDDLRPSEISPCINNGDSSIDNAIDILGNPRPLPAGTNPDIGAYEIDQMISNSDDARALSEIIVFPNPSIGQINTSEEVNILELYSLSGQLLMQKMNTDHLEADGFSNGVYILKMKKGNGSKEEKVVIMN